MKTNTRRKHGKRSAIAKLKSTAGRLRRQASRTPDRIVNIEIGLALVCIKNACTFIRNAERIAAKTL